MARADVMRRGPIVAGPRLRLAVLCAAALVTWIPGAFAQAQTTIGFGFVAARAGRSVTLPLSLRNEADAPVVRVVSRIRFPSAHATFERLEPTALRDGEEAVNVTFEVKDIEPKPAPSAVRDPASPPADKVVEIRVTNKQNGHPISDGILTFVVFKVADDLPPEKIPEIPLLHEATIATTVDGQAVAAKAEPGRILLETKDAPIVQCFFYMH